MITAHFRIALAHKELDYEPIYINLLKKEQASPEYSKVNPNKTVPSLELDDGTILTQSIAIIEMLDELYPQKPLLPKDPYHRALVRQIAHTIASDIQPLQNLRVLNIIGDELKAEFAKTVITNGLTAVEEMLSKTAGKFCVGNLVTIADCCLVPQVYNANRFNVDMNEFPLISRISKDLMELESFQAATPDNQGDAVKQ